MNFKKNVLLAVALAALALACAGCAPTIRPAVVKSSVASFDGNEQNSGLVRFLPDGSAAITPHARDRYNALIELYGNRFTPALAHDAGITPAGDVWRIDAQHLSYFATLSRWKKENLK